MELRQLKYFVSAAEHLHFGKAAHEVGVSQPALSQQIKQLEESLGVELFDREIRKKYRKVQLTPAGKYLLEEARKILEISRKIKVNIGYSMAQKQTVKLGVYKAMFKKRIVEFIDDYKRKTPFTEISIYEYNSSLEVQDALLAEEIDLGLTLLPIKHETLEYEVLSCGKLGYIVPAGHPAATTETDIKDLLQNEKWIELSEKFHPLYHEIEEKCRETGVERQIVQEVTSLNLLVSLVGLGNGVAFAPVQFNYDTEPNVVLKSLEGTLFEDLEICHVVARRR